MDATVVFIDDIRPVLHELLLCGLHQYVIFPAVPDEMVGKGLFKVRLLNEELYIVAQYYKALYDCFHCLYETVSVLYGKY